MGAMTSAFEMGLGVATWHASCDVVHLRSVLSEVGTLALTALSQPQVTSRLSGCVAPLAETSEPAGVAGAHETAFAPTECAASICLHTPDQRELRAQGGLTQSVCIQATDQGAPVYSALPQPVHRLACAHRER